VQVYGWHQVKTVLVALNYRQVATGDEFMIFKNGDSYVTFEKADKFDQTAVVAIGREVGISFKDFGELCRKEYARRYRAKTT